MSALVLANALIYIKKYCSIRSPHPLESSTTTLRSIFKAENKTCHRPSLKFLYIHLYYFPQQQLLVYCRGLMLNEGLQWWAVLRSWAIMAFYFSVSVWMRKHTISTTGCSMLVSLIIGQSTGIGLESPKNKRKYTLMSTYSSKTLGQLYVLHCTL